MNNFVESPVCGSPAPVLLLIADDDFSRDRGWDFDGVVMQFGVIL